MLQRLDADRCRVAAVFRSRVAARPLKIVAPLRWPEASRGLREGTLVVAVVVVFVAAVVVVFVVVALALGQAASREALTHRTC